MISWSTDLSIVLDCLIDNHVVVKKPTHRRLTTMTPLMNNTKWDEIRLAMYDYPGVHVENEVDGEWLHMSLGW